MEAVIETVIGTEPLRWRGWGKHRPDTRDGNIEEFFVSIFIDIAFFIWAVRFFLADIRYALLA